MNPTDIAIGLVEEGVVTSDSMWMLCLNHMTEDEVLDMLKTNELTDEEIG